MSLGLRLKPIACAGIIAAAVLASGCTMPQAVSSLSEVQQSSAQGQITLVPVTSQTMPPAPHPVQASFPPDFSSPGEFNYDRLGPGDRLQVRIWESGTPSVFAASGGGSDLGEVTVDETGRLFLPYVGALRVSGMTIAEVRTAATRRLRSVILDPQVDIRPVEQRSKLVSLQGDAAKTGSFPITRGRTRLGELLAEAAPNQKNPEMAAVTVRRNGQAATVRLSDIYRNPELDIALRPGDSIVINEVVENVTVLGAAGVQGQVRIPERDFSLIDALGQARGLNEEAADPRAVFVMRAGATPETPPIVYQFDMRRPESIALANQFIVQDNDAVLISNASFAQTRRVLSAFAQTLGTVRSATAVVP